MVGQIEDRLQQDLKDVSLDKPYDLIIARWGLGYLEEEDVVKFLKKARSKLLERSTVTPGCMVFMETELDTGQSSACIGDQNLWLRSIHWYIDMFQSCGFEVKIQWRVDVRDNYYPDVIFCIVPIPDELPAAVAAYMSSANGTHTICESCNQDNFQELKDAYLDKAVLFDA